MKHIPTYIETLLIPPLTMLLMAACSHADDDGGGEVVSPVDGTPIAFTSTAAETQVAETRASGTKLTRNFQLYGFKTSATYYQTVFSNYTLQYSPETNSDENLSGYYYVGIVANDVTQTIKYWDMSAEKYQFFALCSDSEVTFSGDGDLQVDDTQSINHTMTATLNITSVDDPIEAESSTSGETTTTTTSLLPLYTEVQTVESDEYGEVVQLKFKRPVAQVRYRFVITDSSASSDEISAVVNVSSFGPTAQTNTEKIYTGGTATVKYSSAGTEVTFEGTTEFNNGATATDGTSVNTNLLNKSDTWFTVLPTGTDVGYTHTFTLSADIGGVTRTTTVPAADLKWQPGYQYTYIFKISSDLLSIILIDVVVDEWVYGGYVEDVQTHW